jgi:hypothetical protein
MPPDSEVIVGDEIIAAEGYVLAVRILHDKSTYNTVEDLSGRMVSLRAVTCSRERSGTSARYEYAGGAQPRRGGGHH